MARSMTLSHVKALLDKGKVDTGLLKETDAFLGIVALIAPAVVGLPIGVGAAVAAALTQREPLVKIGQALLDRLKGVGAGDEVSRLERLQAAHLLIAYTAFFDT